MGPCSLQAGEAIFEFSDLGLGLGSFTWPDLYIYRARRFYLSLLGPRFSASGVLCRTAGYHMERCGISCCIGRVPVLSGGLIGRPWGIS